MYKIYMKKIIKLSWKSEIHIVNPIYKWIYDDVHNLEESIFKYVISPPYEL